MKKLFILIAAASLMVACAEDITTNQTDGDKRYISFSVSNEQNTSTRSVIAPWAEEQSEMADVEKKVVEVETDFPTEYPLSLTITDEPFIRCANSDITRGALLNSGDAASLQFGVTEFLTTNPTTPIFSNSKPAHERTLDDGRELFKANEFWEYDSYDGISYDFYAYAPHVEGTGLGITLSNHNRTISYNAAGVNVGNQPDLMTARKWASSYVGAIPLNFQHRLCAIQIVTAGTWATGYHVSGVEFTNVISSGTFNIDTDKDDAWTNKGVAGDYTVTGFNEADATGTTITGTVTPTSDERWLMLPPQTLDGAKLSITMSDGTNEYTISAPIHASTWRAGHTVTYTVSPEAVSDLIVNYPTGSARSWNDGSNPVTGPVTTYTDADRFGLFVLDKDNNIFISNQCVTPTAGDAAASRTLNIPSLFKSKQFRYFLMYPYIDDAALEALVGTANYESYYKQNATGRPASADAFFAEVIANWAPVNDQSTEATFKAQDLQIAKLSGDHFDMVHKMGLLACTLPDGITSNDVITYDGNNYNEDAEGEKWPRVDSKCTTMTWYASTTFTSSTDIPYKSGSTLYYVAKPGNTTISMSTSSSTGYYDWSVSGASTTVSTVNAYKTFTIASPDLSDYYNKKVWDFSYVGDYKTWEAPNTGTYTLECWGAGTYYGGYAGGGYVAGNLVFDASMVQDMTLYVYVGQKGVSAGSSYSFNGGGYSTGGTIGCGGTDMRTTSGAWNNTASLRSRIIVAGGSCGGTGDGRYNTGAAGGITGYQGRSSGDGGNIYDSYCGRGGGQRSGGAAPTKYSLARSTGDIGRFGLGGYGGLSQNSTTGTGGGGGWYGGSGGSGAGNACFPGGGGSSFISGHPYCDGMNSSGTHQGASNPSKVLFNGTGSEHTITFTSTLMIDGAGYKWTSSSRGSYQQMPNPEGGYYASGRGHSGHGFARITYTRP